MPAKLSKEDSFWLLKKVNTFADRVEFTNVTDVFKTKRQKYLKLTITIINQSLLHIRFVYF